MPFHSVGFFKRLANALYVLATRYDINHISGDVHYIAIFMRKRKSILTIHDLEILKRTSGMRHRAIKFFWFTLPVRRVRFITVISEATRNELLQHVSVSPDKIRVIYNCLPGKMMFQPKPFSSEKPMILQVGTKQNKNIPRLLEAIKGIPCKLVILGKVPVDVQQLLNQFDIDYETVQNLSPDEVVALYVRADMLAFVSTEEGFGIPILEAQATGRPVVTSNISSMPEVAGEGAVFVDPYNIESIREGILRIINEPALRDSIVQKGFENIKRFTPEKIAAQYVALYREVLEEVVSI